MVNTLSVKVSGMGGSEDGKNLQHLQIADFGPSGLKKCFMEMLLYAKAIVTAAID